MKRIIITQPHCVEIEETGSELKVQNNQVLIKVLYITLCGSDYALYNGTYGGINHYPIVIGHEWSGSVVATSETSAFSIGDIVTGDCSLWCGQCDTCLTNKNLCRNIQKFGITHHGACQEFITVDEKYLYKSPLSLPAHLVALSEIFAVAYHAVANIDITISKRIVIIGCGTLGIAVYSLLRYYSNYTGALTLYDKDTNKVDFIKSLTFIQPEDIQCLSHCHNTEGYSTATGHNDYAVECSGSSAGLDTALSYLKPGGRLLALGMYKDHGLNTASLVIKGIRILGIVGGTGYFQPAMEFLNNHQHIGNSIITNSVPFTQAPNLFGGKRSLLKEQLYFN